MDSSKPVAIFQNDCQLHRVLWLGASVSDGEWICCAKRLSRCWQLRPLAWFRRRWRWRVAAEVAEVAEAAVEAASAVAASTAAALVVAASTVAWPAAASTVAWPAAASVAAWLADSAVAGWPADSVAVKFMAAANFGVVDSVIATSG